MKRRLTQALVVACAAFAALLPATSAAAHVTVTPTTATAGGRATFTFKVPNESDTAKTVQLEVVFPDNAALTSASLRPVPGWSATVNRKPSAAPAQPTEQDHTAAAGAVTSIVWRSEVGVGKNEFQTFDVAVGQLPKEPTTLVFKALQTYSDGVVVRWIDVPQDGAPRPEHPAMVVTVAAPPAAPAAEPAPANGTALALAGLVIALLALGLTIVALLRRRPAPPASPDVPARPGNAGKQPVKAGRR